MLHLLFNLFWIFHHKYILLNTIDRSNIWRRPEPHMREAVFNGLYRYFTVLCFLNLHFSAFNVIDSI